MQSGPFGVIEGFYGDPWSLQERLDCISALGRWGADTYVWAPKSEPRHRDAWNEPFTSQEVEGFRQMELADGRVSVSVGLTPGRDATVSDVMAKLAPALEVTDGAVTICFDDLPALESARHHRAIANGVADAAGRPVWLVPTHYAGTAGSPYLDELCGELDESVLVMWTGRHVVSPGISAAETGARAVACGGRAPLVWDNVPVNDAMMRNHLHMGPFTGRERGAAEASAGWLMNPMISMRASLPTIRSGCAWWAGTDARAAWDEEVDAQGLRLLAGATAYPGDPHWPGDEPSTGWLQEVAALTDVADPDLDPWVDSARRGAAVALAARAISESFRSGERTHVRGVEGIGIAALRDWLLLAPRTLGAGPRTRPLFTQTPTGHFAMESGSVELTESIPEREVRRALGAMRDAERGGT